MDFELLELPLQLLFVDIEHAVLFEGSFPKPLRLLELLQNGPESDHLLPIFGSLLGIDVMQERVQCFWFFCKGGWCGGFLVGNYQGKKFQRILFLLKVLPQRTLISIIHFLPLDFGAGLHEAADDTPLHCLW